MLVTVLLSLVMGSQVDIDCALLNTILLAPFSSTEDCCKAGFCSTDGPGINYFSSSNVAASGFRIEDDFWSVVTSFPFLDTIDLFQFPYLPALPPSIGQLPLEYIYIEECGLAGPLPAEIGNITTLNTLQIRTTQLSGPLPASVGNLVGLVELNVDNNALTSIPLEINNLVHLDRLDISHNPFTEPLPSLVQLKSLTWLTMNNCSFHGKFPSWISTLSNLTTLYVGSNKFEFLPDLVFDMKQLQDLDISHNRYVSADFVEKVVMLTNLQTISIRDNSISHIPRTISNLQNLNTLDLSTNLLVDLPDELFLLPKVYQLYVSNNQITSTLERFAWMKSLQILDISYNNFYGPIPKGLEALPLSYFKASVNNLQGEIPHYFFTLGNDLALNSNYMMHGTIPADMKVLRVDLSHVPLTGSLPASICKIDYLATLKLSNCSLQGTVPSCLASSTGLYTLDLSSNNFTGPLFDISRLTMLLSFSVANNQLSGSLPQFLPVSVDAIDGQIFESLDVSNNRFSGALPASWNASFLKTLDVSGNQLNGSLDRFGGLPELVRLSVANNAFSGTLNDSFHNLTKLQYFNASHNNLTASLPATLPNLSVIDLSFNQFSGAIPSSWKTATTLSTLFLAHNNIIDSIPSFFKDFDSLVSLDLSYTMIVGPLPDPNRMPLNATCNLSQFMCINLNQTSQLNPLCTSSLNTANPFPLVRPCDSAALSNTTAPLFSSTDNGTTVFEQGILVPDAIMLSNGTVLVNGTQIYPPNTQPTSATGNRQDGFITIAAAIVVAGVGIVCVSLYAVRVLQRKQRTVSDPVLSIPSQDLTVFSEAQVTGGLAAPKGRDLATVPSTRTNRTRSLIFAMDFKLEKRICENDSYGELYAVRYSRKMALAKVASNALQGQQLRREAVVSETVSIAGLVIVIGYLDGVPLKLGHEHEPLPRKVLVYEWMSLGVLGDQLQQGTQSKAYPFRYHIAYQIAATMERLHAAGWKHNALDQHAIYLHASDSHVAAIIGNLSLVSIVRQNPSQDDLVAYGRLLYQLVAWEPEDITTWSFQQVADALDGIPGLAPGWKHAIALCLEPIVNNRPRSFRALVPQLPQDEWPELLGETALLQSTLAAESSLSASLQAQAKHATSEVSTQTFDENGVLQILIPFENTISRNLTSLRVDKITKLTADRSEDVPHDSALQVTVIVKDEQQALLAGLAVARNWPMYDRKTEPGKRKVLHVTCDFLGAAPSAETLTSLRQLTKAIRNCARLMGAPTWPYALDTPCEELRVSDMVKEAQELVARLASPHVSIKVIQGHELKEKGFGGLWGVGKGEGRPLTAGASVLPALVVLSYQPPKATKTLAMVGKGIVYDTGGLSIKSTAGMSEMKFDKGGACAVLNAFDVMVQQGLSVNVHGLLCLAENSVGPDSFRNDDILTLYSGKTVEVNNTDAEGRLVLGDGVAYASQHLSPDVLIDM
ncbi:putative aminopeptidase npepl1, partial [Kappamyces sp. JEL0680]